MTNTTKIAQLTTAGLQRDTIGSDSEAADTVLSTLHYAQRVMFHNKCSDKLKLMTKCYHLLVATLHACILAR
jgi:hypothetical protein